MNCEDSMAHTKSPGATPSDGAGHNASGGGQSGHDPGGNAARIARALARMDGRAEDDAYIDYLTAINEVACPATDAQIEGIARLGRIVVHPEHGDAALAILESFVAEAATRSEGVLSPAAALHANEILAVQSEANACSAPRRIAERDPAPSASDTAVTALRVGTKGRRPVWSTDMARRVFDRRRADWALALAAAIVAGLGGLMFAGALGAALGTVLPRPSRLTLVVLACGIVGMSVLRSASVYTYRVTLERMQIRLAAEDRRFAVRAYLSRPQHWADRRSLDRVLAVVRGDGERTWYAMTSLPFVLGTLIAALFSVVALGWVDWLAGLAAGLTLAALIVLTLSHLARITEPSRRSREHSREVEAAAADCVDAAAVESTDDAVPRGSTRLVVAAQALRGTRVELETVRARYAVLLELVPVAGVLLVSPLIVTRPGGAGAIGLAVLAVVVVCLALPIRASAWLLGELPSGVARWESAMDNLRADADMHYGSRELPVVADGPGELRFDCAGLTNSAGRVVLPRLDFSVANGQLVAIAGASPEEAHAISALAARHLDPTSGAITLAGADLRELTEDSLANRITWVSDIAGLPEKVDNAHGEPHLMVVNDTHGDGPTVPGTWLPTAMYWPPAASALIVTNRRAVLASADEVIYLESGQVVGRGSHERLFERFPAYAALVIDSEGDEACPDCGERTGRDDQAIDEATERHHAADRLAAVAAGPRSFVPLRRSGTTCHAHRTISSRESRCSRADKHEGTAAPRDSTPHIDADHVGLAS